MNSGFNMNKSGLQGPLASAWGGQDGSWDMIGRSDDDVFHFGTSESNTIGSITNEAALDIILEFVDLHETCLDERCFRAQAQKAHSDELIIVNCNVVIRPKRLERSKIEEIGKIISPSVIELIISLRACSVSLSWVFICRWYYTVLGPRQPIQEGPREI